MQVYELCESRPEFRSNNDFIAIPGQDGYLVRINEVFPTRFDRFRKFHHNLLQREYPLQHEEQGVVVFYPETGIEFLTLNTAWDIDKRSNRISIQADALSRGLLQSRNNRAGLRIVVWHHAVWNSRQIANPDQVARLIKAGYRICLHGDVHTDLNR